MKNLTCLKIHISPHIIPAAGTFTEKPSENRAWNDRWVSNKKRGIIRHAFPPSLDHSWPIDSNWFQRNGWNKITVLTEMSHCKQSVYSNRRRQAVPEIRGEMFVCVCMCICAGRSFSISLLFLFVVTNVEKVHYAECRSYYTTSPFARIYSFSSYSVLCFAQGVAELFARHDERNALGKVDDMLHLGVRK